MFTCTNRSVSASGAIWRVNMKIEKTANVMPTSGECVHLVTCVHFWSLDEDGGYTTRSAIPENAMLHANITALCLTELELLPIKVLHCRNRNFWLQWPRPWPDDLHIQTWPVVHRDIPQVQIWTSYIKAFESYHLIDRHAYRHTDRHNQNYTPRRFADGQIHSAVDRAVR